jgi:hypothetical protein
MKTGEIKMDLERYNRDHLNYRHRKRTHRRVFFFLFFLSVLGAILFSAFSEGGWIVGNVVSSSQNIEDSMNIRTSLSVPHVVLKGIYEEVVLSLDGGQFVYMDNKRIPLEGSENKIILKNFKGDINLDENQINSFSGKVSELRINGVSINLEGDGSLKFSIPSNSSYTFFEIKEGVSLKEVFFVASGEVFFEDDSLNLNSEMIKFENYFGGLKIEDKRLVFDGIASRINIEGNSRKIILSKN